MGVRELADLDDFQLQRLRRQSDDGIGDLPIE